MKRDKIIYWIATGLLAAGMGMSAYMYLSRSPELIEAFKMLGFPVYFVTILGVAKLLGAIALIAPVWVRVKEWAYAGFVFTFVGAACVHIATGTPWMRPVMFLLVLAVSYMFWIRLNNKTTSA